MSLAVHPLRGTNCQTLLKNESRNFGRKRRVFNPRKRHPLTILTIHIILIQNACKWQRKLSIAGLTFSVAILSA